MKKMSFMMIPIFLLILSCQPKVNPSLTEEEATAILNKLMETLSNADTTLVDEIIHPDCVLSYPLLPEPIRGINAYKEFIKSSSNTFSEYRGKVEDVNIKRDRIWSRYSMSGINTGPLGKIPATGKKFQVIGMGITRIKDGKIIEDETYWNVLGFFQQLGFTLTPPKVDGNS